MSAPNLTEKELNALAYHGRGLHGGWHEATHYGIPHQTCAKLVRAGLMESMQQSEQVRGERRISYKQYRVTPAGIAVSDLAKSSP